MNDRETIKIRAPKKLIYDLRQKMPGMTDADIFRVTYNFSALRLEMGLSKIDKMLSKKKRLI